MSFYSELAATASRLLRGKGQPVTIVREGSMTFKPIWAVDLPYPSRDVDGMEIQRDDRRVIIEIGVEPKLTDRIVIGTVVCAIINIKRVAPAGEPVLYIIQARSGG